MRVCLTALSDSFELAGSLARDDALDNPRAAGRAVTAGPLFPGGPVTVLDPGPVADDQDRNLDVLRIANRAVARLGTTTLAGGAFVDVTGTLAHGTRPLRGTLGTYGNLASNFDARGNLRTRGDQDAANHHADGQAKLRLGGGLVTVLGLQHPYAERDNDAILNDGRAARYEPGRGHAHRRARRRAAPQRTTRALQFQLPAQVELPVPAWQTAAERCHQRCRYRSRLRTGSSGTSALCRFAARPPTTRRRTLTGAPGLAKLASGADPDGACDGQS